MNINQLMLHTAVTNRTMELYKENDFNINEVSRIIQNEINYSMDLTNGKINLLQGKENILSIINKVITNIQANGNDEEWSKVCVATLDYIKSQITYIEGDDVSDVN